MRITDLLKKQGISLGVAPKTKREAIDILVSLHEKCGNLVDTAAYKDGILAREDMGTTAIGMEVAIPHAKSEAVKAPALTAITVPGGVDYESPEPTVLSTFSLSTPALCLIPNSSISMAPSPPSEISTFCAPIF